MHTGLPARRKERGHSQEITMLTQLLANVCKQNITRLPYEIDPPGGRHSGRTDGNSAPMNRTPETKRLVRT